MPRRGLGQEYRFLLDDNEAAQTAEAVRWHCRLSDEKYLTPWRVTMYWDTPDLAIYRSAETGSSLSLRFREYHAECPSDLLTVPNAWAELKSSAARGRKERVRVDAADLAAFVACRDIAPAFLKELPSRAIKWIAAGARPVMVTRFKRIAYEGINDHIRVTVDQQITYLAAGLRVNVEGAHCMLGPTVAAERGALIEIASSVAFPTWAVDLVASLEQRADNRPSKFILGMRHLLERSAASDSGTQRAS